MFMDFIIIVRIIFTGNVCVKVQSQTFPAFMCSVLQEVETRPGVPSIFSQIAWLDLVQCAIFIFSDQLHLFQLSCQTSIHLLFGPLINTSALNYSKLQALYLLLDISSRRTSCESFLFRNNELISEVGSNHRL